MKAILFGTFCLLSTLAVAQPQPGTFSVTPKVGVNFNKWSGDLSDGNIIGVLDLDAYYNYQELHKDDKTQGQVPELVYYNEMQQEFRKHTYKVGFSGGVDFQHQLTKHWAVTYGLNYSFKQSGYKNSPDVTVYLRDPQFDFKTNSFGYKMHYFQMPVMLKRYLYQGLALSTGVQFCFLRQSYREYEGQFKLDKTGTYSVRDELYDMLYLYGSYEQGRWYDFENELRISEDFERLDVAIPISLSYEVGPLVTDFRYELGLRNLIDTDEVKSRNRTFVLSIGYRFDL